MQLTQDIHPDQERHFHRSDAEIVLRPLADEDYIWTVHGDSRDDERLEWKSIVRWRAIREV
jgi:hypothetical protein